MHPRYRVVVQYVVGVVVLVHAIYTYYTSRNLKEATDSGVALATQVFSGSVVAAMVGLWLWEHWIWSWPLVQRIPSVTRCISGTWQGTFQSLWKDPVTGDGIGIRDAYLCVRQTFSSTSVRFYTAESSSKSFTAVITRDTDGSWCLAEIYSNEPRIALQKASRSHLGAMRLEISGAPSSRMQGHYWNDRNSTGELSFVKRNRSHADCFEDAAKLF